MLLCFVQLFERLFDYFSVAAVDDDWGSLYFAVKLQVALLIFRGVLKSLYRLNRALRVIITCWWTQLFCFYALCNNLLDQCLINCIGCNLKDNSSTFFLAGPCVLVGKEIVCMVNVNTSATQMLCGKQCQPLLCANAYTNFRTANQVGPFHVGLIIAYLEYNSRTPTLFNIIKNFALIYSLVESNHARGVLLKLNAFTFNCLKCLRTTPKIPF